MDSEKQQEVKHSPLPWRVDGMFICSGKERIVADAWTETTETHVQCLANAALIVHRVNTYEALVEALKEAQWSNGGFCPLCTYGMRRGHESHCVIGSALRLASSERVSEEGRG